MKAQDRAATSELKPDGKTTCCNSYTSCDENGIEYCKGCYGTIGGATSPRFIAAQANSYHPVLLPLPPKNQSN